MFKTELTPPLRAISAIALMLPLCGVAAPTITVDRVQQRYPWNGLVDIDYTIDGMDEGADPVDYWVKFSVSEPSVGFSFVPSNFVGCACCDLPSTNGTYRVTWDSVADGCSAVVLKASVTAQLVREFVTDRDADYLIVDISGGQEATTYPTRCVRGNYDSSVFNRDVYKTERLVLKRVRAGEFWMGAGLNGDVSDPASSRHRVRLTKDFYLGIFPVTQRQYELVMGVKHGGASESVVSTGLTKPTFDWTWDAIMGVYDEGFFQRVNARARYHVRPSAGFGLPTEAQREYAARAGCEKSFVYGSNEIDDLPRYAYYSANKGDPGGGSDSGTYYPLCPVGTFLPNAWGFYDMQSHVLEWCADFYGDYPAGTEEDPAVDPTGPELGTERVLRGGCSLRTASEIGLGYRSACVSTYNRIGAVHAVYGFRLVKSVP